MRMILLALVALVLVAGGAVYMTYGTVEPCSIVREQLRRRAVAEGGSLGSLVASMTPDSVINAMLQAQYNRPVSPSLCIAILVGAEKPPLGKRPAS